MTFLAKCHWRIFFNACFTISWLFSRDLKLRKLLMPGFKYGGGARMLWARLLFEMISNKNLMDSSYAKLCDSRNRINRTASNSVKFSWFFSHKIHPVKEWFITFFMHCWFGQTCQNVCPNKCFVEISTKIKFKKMISLLLKLLCLVSVNL